MSQPPFLNRQALYLRPDPARVVVRPFKPATEPRDFNPTDKSRANHIVDRVLSLDPASLAMHLAEVLENFQGRHRNLLETFEAGIALLGTEVKAIREGRVNLRDSFARIDDGEVYLYNVNISSYSHRGYVDHEPLRARKLLLHRDEIRKLIGKTVERGMTLVPVRMYFKNGRIKIAISLAKGKKEYDKRETIKKREVDRETRAAVKSRR